MANPDNVLATGEAFPAHPPAAKFGLLSEAFHPGSLSTFSYLHAKGQHIDAERIAAIKAKNSDWERHETFRTYCEDFERGRIRRKRGRPRQPVIIVRDVVAMLEYPVYLKLLRRWRRQGRRSSMMARHHPDPALAMLDDCHGAAQIVCAKHRRPYTPARLLVKISEERRRG